MDKGFIKLGTLLTTIAFALVAGIVYFSHPVAQPVQATAPACNGNIVVDKTQSVTNDPDSGNHGNWANDNFSRHLQIWKQGSTYCGQITDNGTFTTTGPNSPQAGTALSAGITGTFNGGAIFTISGTPKDDLGDINPPTLDCSVSNCVTDGTLHLLLQNYFTGDGHSYSTWGWTYATCQHGTWTDASTGESGDITNATSTSVCASPTPTPTKDCDGDTDGGKPDSDDVCITPSVTPILDCDHDTDGSNPNGDDACANPTATPTATPTAAPTPTATPNNNNNGGTGGGDGRSDGLSSCPSCTQAPQGQVLGASTQAVLGASTMASTGTFEETLVNDIAGMGILMMAAAYIYAKKAKTFSK